MFKLNKFIRCMYTSTIDVYCHNHKRMIPVISKTVDKTILTKAVESKPFTNWLTRIDQNPKYLNLRSINIQSVDMFGPRVGFIKFVADVYDADGDKCNGSVFMRGGSVAVLPILSPINGADSDKYTILVQMDCVPIATPQMPSLPAGMIDDDGNFAGAMAKEIKEETDIIINQKDLYDMTEIVCGNKYQGLYPSCGGTDEWIRLFTFNKYMMFDDIMKLQNKLTGLRSENEKIRLKIVKLKDLYKETPDMKALSAMLLYEKLISSKSI